MRKIVAGVTGTLAALTVSACTPSNSSAEPTSSPAKAASAPNATQLRGEMQDWHRACDKTTVPMVVDLDIASQNTWQSSYPEAKVLAETVTKDTKAAMDCRPIRDDEARISWVAFLKDMQTIGEDLTSGLGSFDKPNDAAKMAKVTEEFKKADSDYKKFYDRNQLIFDGKG